MLNSEIFSEMCWSDKGAVKWNRMTKRGIKNRLQQSVVDDSVPYPVICNHPTKKVVMPYGQYRGYRVTKCCSCGATLHTEDSTD